MSFFSKSKENQTRNIFNKYQMKFIKIIIMKIVKWINSHEIWQYYNSISDNEIECSICKRRYKNSLTDTIKKHFRNKHSEKWNEICKKKKKIVKETIQESKKKKLRLIYNDSFDDKINFKKIKVFYD
jgi:hypothetical protein